MSFGFSPSDIVALVNLATKTYRGWKTACGDYADITSSFDGLLILLERIEDEAEQPHTALVRSRKDRDDLSAIVSSCHSTVQELSSIISKFRSLGPGKSREKNWDRIRFGNKNLDSLKAKLLQHQSALSAYLNTVGLSSLTRIERDLHALPDKIQKTVDGLAAEIRAGRREGTVMTTYEDDEKDVWKQFRRELIGDGMKSSFVHKYKPQIRKYLRALAEDGLLEEDELPSEDGGTSDIPRSSLSCEIERHTPDEQVISLSTPSPSTSDPVAAQEESADDQQDPDSISTPFDTPADNQTRNASRLGVADTDEQVERLDEGEGSVSTRDPLASRTPYQTTVETDGSTDADDMQEDRPSPDISTAPTIFPGPEGERDKPDGNCKPVHSANVDDHDSDASWSSITGCHISSEKQNSGKSYDLPVQSKNIGNTDAPSSIVTKLPKRIFYAAALDYRDLHFREFHDHFKVYTRLADPTDYDTNLLQHSPEGKVFMTLVDPAKNLTMGPVETFLPQSKVASTAINTIGYHLDRRIGGYYVVDGSLNNNEIFNLTRLSRIHWADRQRMPSSRPQSPTRAATATVNTSSARAKPFTITIEGNAYDKEPKTWFPKTGYSIWTMLALGRVFQHRQLYYIIRGGFTAEELAAAVEMNDSIRSDQASGMDVSWPTVQHLQAAWNDPALAGNTSLGLWLSGHEGVWQGVWQICGPVSGLYAARARYEQSPHRSTHVIASSGRAS